MPAAQIDFDVILEGRLNKLRVFVTQAQGENLFYNVSVENWSGDQNAPQILARVENALIERQNHKWGLILTVANIAARVAVKVLLGQLVNLRKLSNTYCVEDPENLSELFAYSLPVTALGSSRVAILDYFYQLHFIDKFNGVLEEELMIATGIHLENIQQIIGTLSAESILEFVQKNWRLQRTPVAVQAAKEAFEKYQSISRNPEQEKRSMTQDPKKVFIVHGWNDAAVKATQQFLQSVGLHSDPFETVRSKMSGTVSIPTIIRKAFEEAQAIIVLWTPDEWVDSRPSIRDAEMKDKSNGRWQPRPNVLIEAGAAILKETDRTILLGVGLQDAPSDFAGLHLFRMNNAAPQRQRLLNMLKASGCEVNPTNENYLDSRLGGDFETCVSTATLPEVNGEVTFHNH